MIKIVINDSNKIIANDNIKYYNIDDGDDIDELTFRKMMRLVNHADYFVVNEIRKYTGIFIGIALCNNIPVISLGEEVHGNYGRFSQEFWGEFIEHSAKEHSVIIDEYTI